MNQAEESAPDSIGQALSAPGLTRARARFQDTLAQRILALESLRQDIRAGRDAPGALHEIAKEAHKFSGVAATLGHEDVGRLASDVDRLIGEGMSLGLSADETLEQLNPLLDMLLDSLERALED
ncbi:MAG: Hpt domain-containing protein [Paracoccaceae bacterium]